LVFLPRKKAQQNASIQWYTPQVLKPFKLLKPTSEQAHGPLLPRLSWSWSMVLLISRHRKPISSIIAVYFHLWPICWLFLVSIEV
jgi:hypothetical protein